MSQPNMVGMHSASLDKPRVLRAYLVGQCQSLPAEGRAVACPALNLGSLLRAFDNMVTSMMIQVC